MSVIELRNLKRHYVLGDITVKAIRGLDLDVDSGEFVSVMGPSGSGKSTLMNVLGCLDKPTEGSYFLDGIDISKADENTFADIRNRKIGFVFQGFNLLSRTTALENVQLPLLYRRGALDGDADKLAREALEVVGLGSRFLHLPSQLSGGQQQRVAIARAMINKPTFILADEPTGNLDSEMTMEVMALFQELNAKGITIVMVTHEPEVAAFTGRTITMRDGAIISDRLVAQPKNASLDLAAKRARGAA
ncbi:MAG: ABC transporter ATP-binding protein [Spirochaetales bacterium]|jgi:putative ABC transport system ATP-binding protein